MLGMVHLVLVKYVWLDPDTGYLLMNYIILVDMRGPERVHPKKVVGHAARLSDLRSQKS